LRTIEQQYLHIIASDRRCIDRDRDQYGRYLPREPSERHKRRRFRRVKRNRPMFAGALPDSTISLASLLRGSLVSCLTASPA
jgi:hypothetical protein